MSTLTYRNTNRLSIIDPNNPSNDISGGARNTPAILSGFSGAYITLRERMREIGDQPAKGGILEVIIKGNYSSFQRQRAFLRRVHEEVIGPCSD